ncbi:MAG: hypothetical protein ACHRXM_25050 [Isosphaerales bacterium]
MDRTTIRIVRWSCVTLILGLTPAGTRAQAPADGTPPPAVCTRRGKLHRLFHHSAHTIQDKFVGYPDTFKEPPLGYYITEQLGVQVAKADTHRFTLYRSDFLPETSLFSPNGASRFNIMFARFPSWLGPISVEWTPEQPALAQSRRQAILDTMRQAGQPILAQRVVIIPSPYPGAVGTEASNNYSNTVIRSQGAAQTFALPPTETAASGVH